MSEYRCYEWQIIDRTLTAAEQSAVNHLSSHIDVTSTQAWVEYSLLCGGRPIHRVDGRIVAAAWPSRSEKAESNP